MSDFETFVSTLTDAHFDGIFDPDSCDGESPAFVDDLVIWLSDGPIEPRDGTWLLTDKGAEVLQHVVKLREGLTDEMRRYLRGQGDRAEPYGSTAVGLIKRKLMIRWPTPPRGSDWRTPLGRAVAREE
ncbi:MAG: hypothetical protein K0U16_07140 [Gammaproteobacteria bacterium]|nr:hypothetical protein [Gammaproteobacteria bacterium]